jgi:hypothetical protein
VVSLVQITVRHKQILFVFLAVTKTTQTTTEH